MHHTSDPGTQTLEELPETQVLEAVSIFDEEATLESMAKVLDGRKGTEASNRGVYMYAYTYNYGIFQSVLLYCTMKLYYIVLLEVLATVPVIAANTGKSVYGSGLLSQPRAG